MGKELWKKGDDHVRTLALTANGYIIGGESRSDSKNPIQLPISLTKLYFNFLKE